MYFPHPNTTASVLNYYVKAGDNENLGKILGVIERNGLLKIDESVFSEYLQ